MTGGRNEAFTCEWFTEHSGEAGGVLSQADKERSTESSIMENRREVSGPLHMCGTAERADFPTGERCLGQPHLCQPGGGAPGTGCGLQAADRYDSRACVCVAHPCAGPAYSCGAVSTSRYFLAASSCVACASVVYDLWVETHNAENMVLGWC